MRLRSALMALSGAARSFTTAPMLAPIVEHRSHILRSELCAAEFEKVCKSPPPKAKCGFLARCPRMRRMSLLDMPDRGLLP